MTNRTVDADTAAEMAKIFLEIIVAPAYTPEALEILCKKKNLRVLELPGIREELPEGMLDMKKVMGGLLVQEFNQGGIGELTVPTKRKPTEKEMEDLLFAWKLVKAYKIQCHYHCQRSGKLRHWSGPSQSDLGGRAVHRACRERVKGAVLASDAFFPV